jgi:DHA1 family tetracycline resistance protein-like MFS transporter
MLSPMTSVAIAPERPRPSVAFILVAMFLATLGIGLVLPVMPRLIGSFLGGDLVAASRYYGTFISVYATMQFLFAPLLGAASDRFGRRKVLLASQVGAGLDYLLLAMAPNLGWFFVGRIISGLTGASFSTGAAYIADITPPEKRAQSFGLVGASFGLGLIVGPAVGGLLAKIDLRAPFFAASALYLVNFLYGFFALPESLAPEHRRPILFARANPFGSFKNLGRSPMVFGLACTLVFSYLAQQILQSVWVLYTEGRYGWTPFDIGISLGLVGLATALVQGGLLRVVMPRFGERRTLIFGTVASAVGFVALGLASTGWLAYVLIFPFALRGLASPAAQSLMTQHVGADEQGELQGSIVSLMSVTAIVGPLIGTRLFAHFGGPTSVPYVPGMSYFAAAALDVCGLVLVLRLFARLREEPAAIVPPG